MSVVRLLAVASLGVLTLGTPASAAAQGTVTGRVTGEGGEPVEAARVLVAGTTISAVTAQDGRYTLRNVPVGQQQVRVLRVGFIEQRKPVTVSATEPAALDFTLARSVVQLEGMVSTATGTRPREELGNAVSTVDAARITEQAPITNIQDVLSARVPGVDVGVGSQVGAGGRVRIRGYSSLNLSNDPIYVIDGVRLTSNSGSISNGTGGASPNRVNDLNPDEIESLEIVKGPSAATLYGTDAANGVIVITTKRGRAGSTRWTAYAEAGAIRDNSDYPLNYTLAGHRPGQTALIQGAQCTLSRVAEGACIADSLRVYAPVRDPDATPLSWGHRNQVGVNANGGSDAVRYFISAEREEETSVLKLPEFEQRRFRDRGIPLRDYNMRPNAMDRYSVRANLNASPRPELDLTVSSALISSNTRYILESNATAGLGSQLFGGPGFRSNGNVSGLEAGTATSPLSGYRAWTPGYTFQELNKQQVTRTIVSGTADWRPLSWLQNRAAVGVDYTGRYDYALNRRGEGTPVSGTNRLGYAFDDRTALRTFSADVGSSATWRPRESMSLRSTLGAQYVNYYLEQNNADAAQLPPGAVTPNAGAVLSPTTAATYTKTLGVFFEEQLGWKDRLFITGAVRTDQNSAFGTEFQRVFYPKVSASWVVSEESFFPEATWIDNLRLRTAYGMSGVQPGANDAAKQFDAALTSYRATDSPSAIYTEIGNTSLRPEKTSEIEGGFDARLFGRSNFELTFYQKDTKDALISAPIAPSSGVADDIRRNLGAVRNRGVELFASSQVLERRWLAADIALTFARNKNTLVKLGVDDSGQPLPPIINGHWQARAGYPLFGFWARPITGWQDKNGDGIIAFNTDPALNEVFVGADTIFRGASVPVNTATLLPGVELLERKLRIQALFEYKGGYKHYNNTERIRCASRVNCIGLSNPNAELKDQATAVAHLELPVDLRTLDGFFEKADFVRWREVSASYTLPTSFASRYMRARSATVNVSARNLSLWTSYSGLDPEVDRLAGQAAATVNAPPEEFQTMGIPTYFVVRVNLGF